MDLIDRNELNKKILNLMDSYIGDEQSDGVSVCKKILSYIVDMPSKEIKEENEIPVTAKWIVWDGWKGNCDKRIEDAKCSNCGFLHPTVKGSLYNLSGVCPGCGAKITGFIEKGSFKI